MKLRLFRAYSTIVITLTFFAGCSYHRGFPENTYSDPGGNKIICHIAIAPVKNLSLAPQAEGIFTEQLHRYFTCIPGWQLSEEPQADVILETRLEHFNTHLGSTREEHIQSLHLALTASASLRKAEDNHCYFQNIPFQAETYYEITEINDPYYAAIPLLTRDLVEKIGRAVCYPWEPSSPKGEPFTEYPRSQSTDPKALTKGNLHPSREKN
ncbi:MAG: LPS assembly lipoprotein LptE [Puniceicoccales bacterium]|jgi:hypothetical protein|nr:LPS assembly lipoprotein LptE [Puniceicoccales bacterium]